MSEPMTDGEALDAFFRSALDCLEPDDTVTISGEAIVAMRERLKSLRSDSAALATLEAWLKEHPHYRKISGGPTKGVDLLTGLYVIKHAPTLLALAAQLTTNGESK